VEQQAQRLAAWAELAEQQLLIRLLFVKPRLATAAAEQLLAIQLL
jgi:hypothetical protein